MTVAARAFLVNLSALGDAIMNTSALACVARCMDKRIKLAVDGHSTGCSSSHGVIHHPGGSFIPPASNTLAIIFIWLLIPFGHP